jgi:hypothetical protein
MTSVITIHALPIGGRPYEAPFKSLGPEVSQPIPHDLNMCVDVRVSRPLLIPILCLFLVMAACMTAMCLPAGCQEADLTLEESEECQAVEDALYGATSSDEEHDFLEGIQQHAEVPERACGGAHAASRVEGDRGLKALGRAPEVVISGMPSDREDPAIGPKASQLGGDGLQTQSLTGDQVRLAKRGAVALA